MACIRALCLPDLDGEDDREILVPDAMPAAEAVALARKVIDDFQEEGGETIFDFDELESRLVEAGFIGLNWIGRVSWQGKAVTEVYS